jgi:hypothetical protein
MVLNLRKSIIKKTAIIGLFSLICFTINGCDTPTKQDVIIYQDSNGQDEVVVSTGYTNTSQDYFEPKEEFNYHISLMEKNKEIQDHFFSGRVNTKFYEKSVDYYNHDSCNNYHFIMLPTEDILNIYIPEVCDAILPLDTGVEYLLIYNADYYGYNIESLYIYQGNMLIFAGVTDTSADGYFEEYEKNLPFNVKQNALLTDHYAGSSECVDGIFNTEISFTARGDGSILILHQGQTERLGKYSISLPVAQKVYYNQNCCDYFLHGFSYMISRKSDN